MTAVAEKAPVAWFHRTRPTRLNNVPLGNGVNVHVVAFDDDQTQTPALDGRVVLDSKSNTSNTPGTAATGGAVLGVTVSTRDVAKEVEGEERTTVACMGIETSRKEKASE